MNPSRKLSAGEKTAIIIAGSAPCIALMLGPLLYFAMTSPHFASTPWQIAMTVGTFLSGAVLACYLVWRMDRSGKMPAIRRPLLVDRKEHDPYVTATTTMQPFRLRDTANTAPIITGRQD